MILHNIPEVRLSYNCVCVIHVYHGDIRAPLRGFNWLTAIPWPSRSQTASNCACTTIMTAAGPETQIIFQVLASELSICKSARKYLQNCVVWALNGAGYPGGRGVPQSAPIQIKKNSAIFGGFDCFSPLYGQILGRNPGNMSSHKKRSLSS